MSCKCIGTELNFLKSESRMTNKERDQVNMTVSNCCLHTFSLWN